MTSHIHGRKSWREKRTKKMASNRAHGRGAHQCDHGDIRRRMSSAASAAATAPRNGMTTAEP